MSAIIGLHTPLNKYRVVQCPPQDITQVRGAWLIYDSSVGVSEELRGNVIAVAYNETDAHKISQALNLLSLPTTVSN